MPVIIYCDTMPHRRIATKLSDAIWSLGRVAHWWGDRIWDLGHGTWVLGDRIWDLSDAVDKLGPLDEVETCREG